MKIITDNKWKQFKYRHEIPQKILDSFFDHLDKEEGIDNFIKYKKYYYHISDFMILDESSPWQAVVQETNFSGVLIQISDFGDQYKIATQLN